MPTQNVNLTAELESFVKEQVQSGYFNNASEVHRAALASMRKAEEERQLKMERLKIEVQKGLNSLDAGDTLESNSDIRSSIQASLSKVLSAQQVNAQ